VIAEPLADAPLAQERTTTPVARIYFMPWDATAVVALSVEDLRRQAPYVLELRGGPWVSRLRESLRLGEVSSAKMAAEAPVDVRLVVDFDVPTRAWDTIYASRFQLFSEKTGRIRSIDPEFRKRFEELLVVSGGAEETGSRQ
jgi:hypothetical protein